MTEEKQDKQGKSKEGVNDLQKYKTDLNMFSNLRTFHE